MFRYFEARGRTLVVGDLHGCYDLLQQGLQALDFAPEQGDCLIAVGDLADRGNKSLDCLRLLEHGWFHTVRGNHEQLMLTALRGNSRQAEALWFLNGGSWYAQLPANEQHEVLEFLPHINKLPIAIEVKTQQGHHVGIVHADPVVDDWTEVMYRLRAPNPDPDFVEQLIWSRQRLHRINELPADQRDAHCLISNIELVCMGHTPQPAVRRHGNLLWLDTGAFAGGPLTIVDLDAYLNDSRTGLQQATA